MKEEITIDFNAEKRPARMYDPNTGIETTMQYDEKGNLSCCRNSEGAEVLYTYNESNQLMKAVDTRANEETIYDYTHINQLNLTIRKIATSELVQQMTYSLTGKLLFDYKVNEYEKHFYYDHHGRMSHVFTVNQKTMAKTIQTLHYDEDGNFAYSENSNGDVFYQDNKESIKEETSILFHKED